MKLIFVRVYPADHLILVVFPRVIEEAVLSVSVTLSQQILQ